MKYLINSKYFLDTLLKAYRMRAHRIVVVGRSIKFVGAERDIEIHVEFLDRMDLDIPIKWQHWSKVIQFLRSIPEQPITVKMYGDQIDIYNVQVLRLNSLTEDK
jgi:hypothetical protein